MWKLITLSTCQSLCLVVCQIFLKVAVQRMDNFRFAWSWFRELLTNWQLACSGVAIAVATILWMYILRHFEFSIAYPLISISYVFGMLAAVFIFHEAVPPLRWAGVCLIILGVILVARQ